MSYGSVRQYRNRFTRMRGKDEIGAIAVSCRDCSGSVYICGPCDALQETWGVDVLTFAGRDVGAYVPGGELEELVR